MQSDYKYGDYLRTDNLNDIHGAVVLTFTKEPCAKTHTGNFLLQKKKDEKTMNTMQMKMNHHICEIRFLDSNSAETKIFDIYTPLNIDCNMLHRQMENKDDYLRKKKS